MSDTGWLNFGTYENVAYDDNEPWANVDNAQTENASYATNTTNKNEATDYLKASNISDLSISSGSTIDGIEVRIKRYATYADTSDDEIVILHKGGVLAGDNNADVGTYYPTSNNWSTTYGGPSDMWNSGYDYDDVTDSTFGVALSSYQKYNYIGGYNVYVDVIQIKITYTPGWDNSIMGITSPGKVLGVNNQSISKIIGIE
jgi:hypothetical protein